MTRPQPPQADLNDTRPGSPSDPAEHSAPASAGPAREALTRIGKPRLVTHDGIAPLTQPALWRTLEQGDAGDSNLHLLRMRQALIETQQCLHAAESALEQTRADMLRARHGALHDDITGLPNRKLFDDRLEQAIAIAARREWTLAVLFVDLDKFKHVNDTYGHAAGDRVLTEVAARLSERRRDEDTVCRYGGDEFLFLLMNPKTRDDIERIAAVVAASIAEPVTYGSHQLQVGASVGIAVYPRDATAGLQLIRHADTAMYHAKSQRSGVVFYSDP